MKAKGAMFWALLALPALTLAQHKNGRGPGQNILDRGDGDTAVSQTARPAKSTTAMSPVFIGRMWNAYSPQSSYTNLISFDPISNLAAIVHRTDRTGAGSGQIVYQVSDDQGINWSHQIGPINAPGFNLGRFPNLLLINPGRSTDPTTTSVVVTYNDLTKTAGFGDTFYVTDQIAGLPIFFGEDSLDAFSHAGAVDLNNGDCYFSIVSVNAHFYAVSKLSAGGTSLSPRVTLAPAEQIVESSGTSMDVGADGTVHWVGRAIWAANAGAPDTSTFYWRYQRSTDGGATWSAPEYVGPQLAGRHDSNYEFDMIVGASNQVHLAAVLVDTTAATGTGTALYDLVRSPTGIWSSTKVADIRRDRFADPRWTPGVIQDLNAPELAKTQDGKNLALKWIDIIPNPVTSEDSMCQDVFIARSKLGGPWTAPRNVSQSPGIYESFTNLAPLMSDEDKLFIFYISPSDPAQGNDLNEHDIWFLPDDRIIDQLTLSIPTSLSGAPGSVVKVPLSLDGNTSIAKLEAAIKATNGILTFTGFTPGAIIPGPAFSVNAPAPDSVRLSFSGFGAAPITRNGVLATLHFLVSANVSANAGSLLALSMLSAATPDSMPLPVVGRDGFVTIIKPVSIAGKVQYCSPAGRGDPSKPVAGLTAELRQSNVLVQNTLTDSAGNYSLSHILAGGVYHVDARRASGGIGVAISPTDALLAFNAFLGTGAINGCQKLAADVDGNLITQPLDALSIFNFFLGKISQFPTEAWRTFPASYNIDAISNAWKTAPQQIEYPYLAGDQINQNFYAVVRGDVDLSWPGSTSQVLVQTPRAAPLQFVITRSMVVPSTGATTWRVRLEGAGLRQGVYAFGGELQYEASSLEIMHVRWGEVVPAQGYQLGHHKLPVASNTGNEAAEVATEQLTRSSRLRFGGFSISSAAIGKAGVLLEIETRSRTNLVDGASPPIRLVNVSATVGASQDALTTQSLDFEAAKITVAWAQPHARGSGRDILDRDDGGAAASQILPPAASGAAGSPVFIGRMWNAYSPQSPFTNLISYDPFSNLAAMVHRTDRTGAGSGRLVYQLSDDGGDVWSPQIGPINIPGFNGGRHPNLVISNPSQSTDPTQTYAVVTSNDLTRRLAFGDVHFITDALANPGTPVFSAIDTFEVFSHAGAVDLRNGDCYFSIASANAQGYSVIKLINGGTAISSKVLLASAAAIVEGSGTAIEVGNDGAVHFVACAKWRTGAPDTTTFYWRYQRSTDGGATWSGPEYVGPQIAGMHASNYEFDMIVDANNEVHIAVLLVDTTAATGAGTALCDLVRSPAGIWSGIKITDIRRDSFAHPGWLLTGAEIKDLNVPELAKTKDGNHLALKWIDIVPNPVTPEDSTCQDVFIASLTLEGKWTAPRNVSQSPGIYESFSNLAPIMRDDGQLFMYYVTSSSSPGRDVDEHDIWFLPEAKISIDKVVISIPDTLTESPGRIVDIPVALNLSGKRIGELQASLKATNGILSFTGFTPGPILPGPTFTVIAPTPDSVRLTFRNAGGGPILQDGVLATLHFRISSSTPVGTISTLNFSEVSAADPSLGNLPVQQISGQLKVVIQPVEFFMPDTIAGAPGDTVEAPIRLDRGGRTIAALGAALKATNGLLSFISFAPGAIIPGALFNITAPNPDSVRLAFIDFGGGPVVNDGVLVKLRFRIKPSAQNGEISILGFSELSAAAPDLMSLPVRGMAGKITVKVRGTGISGMHWHDLNRNGVKDFHEPGLKGWTINLTGTAALHATTDSLGNYSFMSLALGAYSVSASLRTGWKQTFPVASGAYTMDIKLDQVISNCNFGSADTTTTVVQNNDPALPETFVLSQNYPNPFGQESFNALTTIKYSVPRQSRVRIEVFNLLGMRVAILVDAVHQPGFHEVKLDLAGLPDGVYFYKLTAPGHVETKKILLLR